MLQKTSIVNSSKNPEKKNHITFSTYFQNICIITNINLDNNKKYFEQKKKKDIYIQYTFNI